MKSPNIFFSYSFSDKEQDVRDRIDNFVKEMRDKHPELPFNPVFGDRHSSDRWQDEVASDIQSCDGFVCVVSKGTQGNANVDWEIKTAVLHRKPLVVTRISKSHQVPSTCKELDLTVVPFKTAELSVAMLQSLLPSAVLNQHADLTEPFSSQALLSQYSIIVGSWEALVNRRQNVNSFYSAVIAAILGGVGACFIHYKDIGEYAAIGGGATVIVRRVHEHCLASDGHCLWGRKQGEIRYRPGT